LNIPCPFFLNLDSVIYNVFFMPFEKNEWAGENVGEAVALWKENKGDGRTRSANIFRVSCWM
jgi:hypothetical protein